MLNTHFEVVVLELIKIGFVDETRSHNNMGNQTLLNVQHPPLHGIGVLLQYLYDGFLIALATSLSQSCSRYTRANATKVNVVPIYNDRMYVCVCFCVFLMSNTVTRAWTLFTSSNILNSKIMVFSSRSIYYLPSKSKSLY